MFLRVDGAGSGRCPDVRQPAKAPPKRGKLRPPRNSCRPTPRRTRTATLKRNKKGERASSASHPPSVFLRRSHGISMLSLSFVSSPLKTLSYTTHTRTETAVRWSSRYDCPRLQHTYTQPRCKVGSSTVERLAKHTPVTPLEGETLSGVCGYISRVSSQPEPRLAEPLRNCGFVAAVGCTRTARRRRLNLWS